MVAVNNLRFQYPKGKTVLNDVSFGLNPGTIYGLFGRNGEGKSTLMKILAGLLFPKEGSCRVSNKDTAYRSVVSLQDTFILPEDFELPALKIKTYAQINATFYPKFSKQEFFELLSEFDLLPDQDISSLSFGQKKKVLIAFGLASHTRLLLMDEPTNGLDIPSKSQFRKIMASAVDQGKCIVISTHQVRDLHSLIDHVIILDQSRLVLDASLADVSRQLWFGKPGQDHKDHILYSETNLGGKAIVHRQQREETEVDLELLFNAVIFEPRRISNALKNSYHESAV
ncbi:MAG: ABC transporter ATP-binding protein [Bacteroidota bacterium]